MNMSLSKEALRKIVKELDALYSIVEENNKILIRLKECISDRLLWEIVDIVIDNFIEIAVVVDDIRILLVKELGESSGEDK